MCRTRVYEDNFGPKTSIARGNLSFTTVNIVRLAIECMHIKDEDKKIQKFFEKLSNVLDLCGKQLHERYEFQKTALAKQFPLVMKSLWVDGNKLNADDNIESVIKHGTLGLGFIGLAECLVALIGEHHGESDRAQNLGLEIVNFFKLHADFYVKKYNHNYSVLATPAEGLSGRFTKIDRKKYGKLKGITDREYYTNSNHVPVYYNCSVEHKAKTEAPYHDLTRGGHIFYVEIDGDATRNPESIKQVVDLMDKHNIGYGSINHTRARCFSCGYESAEHGLTECPQCKSTHLTEIQRITGLTTNWPLVLATVLE